jgi:hypothetical protein
MRRRQSPWIRYKWLIRANLVIWPILLYAYGNWYGIFPPISLQWLTGTPRPGLFAPQPTRLSAIGGEAQLIVSPQPEPTPAPPVGGYIDIRQPVGIVEANLYTERVIQDDAIGKLRASTRDQADVNLEPKWPITADDKVAVLEEWRNEQGRWFKIVIVSSTVDPHYNGQGGWVLAWIIDGVGVPPPPTATIELPTAEPAPTTDVPTEVLEPATPSTVPTVEEIATSTPTDTFEPNPEVVFNKEVVVSTAKVEAGELRGCVDGFVKLHRGVTQATVQFTLGETVKTADVDSNSHYRICDLEAGDWTGLVITLAGEPFDDSDSTQAVPVVEGDVSTASWYEKESQF